MNTRIISLLNKLEIIIRQTEGKIRNSKRYLTRSDIKHFQNVSHRFKIQLTFPEFPETVFKHIKKFCLMKKSEQ